VGARGALRRWGSAQRVVIVLAVALATTAALAEAEPTGRHPWWHDLVSAAPEPPARPPLVLHPLDALELTTHLRGDPFRGEVQAHVGLRLRLDATEHLRGKQADTDALAALLAAGERESAAHARLAAFARRCEGVWRAWQVVLLAPSAPASPDAAYRDALRALLARHATLPAGDADIGACRLSSWIQGLDVHPLAPALVRAGAEGSLSRGAEALAGARMPPTLSLDADVTASRGRSAVWGLRASLDLPLDRGRFGISTGRSNTTVSVSWRSAGADDRITDRLAASRQPELRPDPLAPAIEELERRRDEARLARSDARRRWSRLCGSDEAAVVHACLVAAPLPDTLLDAIDAELAAIHAELAVVAASGHDLATLLIAPP
jgi:hypothetical protein